MFDILAVFHGGTDIIPNPSVSVGREKQDFGPGFYVTDIYTQAKEWSYKIAERREAFPIINHYHLDRKNLMEETIGKIFTAYDKEWLDFVTQSRTGLRPWEGLDYVEGGVADDNVIDSVRLYMAGFLSANATLERLQYFKPANQICFLNQHVLERYLTFVKSEQL